MNSLGIISSIGSTTPSSTPPGSRSNSSASLLGDASSAQRLSTGSTAYDIIGEEETKESVRNDGDNAGLLRAGSWEQGADDEKAPLLADATSSTATATQTGNRWHIIPSAISSAFYGTMKVIISTIVAPATYLVACFYDNEGNFSIMMPLYRVRRRLFKRKRKSSRQALVTTSEDDTDSGKVGADTRIRKLRRSSSGSSSSTAVQTDSDADSVSRHTRSKSSLSYSEDGVPAKRSIRIKLHNDDLNKQRKGRKSSSNGRSGQVDQETALEAAAAMLKSPTGAAVSSKIMRYPRFPVPPRPIVPKRQPSYSNLPSIQLGRHPKTLVLDLDETLIHSQSKGGRYTTGHMVEVKMQSAIGAGGVTFPPQVPILYYVHKRPYCDEFLRKASKWYNLIIFTASVQEYADPVIDWLELERKYFVGRLYRQHCTHRNGAYIKDLAQIEPDLSKVMIIDNSPLSYVFHEDNAVPIEGWISDPTDNGLLHLIPLLEGLQYATDVRAVLSLRLGQPQTG